ncbi:MAG: IPT/TIG domain-containing protein [Rubrivivax sp.]
MRARPCSRRSTSRRRHRWPWAPSAPPAALRSATITINGSGFDPDPFHMQVKFADNLAAEVVSSSATQVVVKVPAGAVTGPVTVTHILTGASVSSGSAFTVTSSGGGGGGTTTWVARASPSSFLLNGLAYGAGRFVAVGFGKTIVTSVDGLSWTAATAPDNNYYEAKSVVWTGSQFVMVGDKNYGASAPPLIATSPDGLAWTRRSWTPAQDPDTLADVAAGGSRLTVVGLNGSLATSGDGGLTWVNETGGAGTSFSGVADSGSVRVAVGRDGSYAGRVLVNSGGGWQVVTAGLGNFYPARITWNGARFVAVGAAGLGGQAVVVTSADGANWTRVEIPSSVVPANFKLAAVAQVGSVLYATGDNGSTQHLIVKSEDQGATWTQVHQATTAGNAMLAGIAASADRVVTVGGVTSVTMP